MTRGFKLAFQLGCLALAFLSGLLLYVLIDPAHRVRELPMLHTVNDSGVWEFKGDVTTGVGTQSVSTSTGVAEWRRDVRQPDTSGPLHASGFKVSDVRYSGWGYHLADDKGKRLFWFGVTYAHEGNPEKVELGVGSSTREVKSMDTILRFLLDSMFFHPPSPENCRYHQELYNKRIKR